MKSVEEIRHSPEVLYVHLDRVPNIQATNSDISDLENDTLEEMRKDSILASANQFIHLFQKQRKALRQQDRDSLSQTRSEKILKLLDSDSLSQTRSGSIVRPLSVKQMKRLDCVPIQSLGDYLKQRK
jgi:hypothetical protein